MKYIATSTVLDDDGTVLGENTVELVMPPAENIEAQHIVLGEGQINMSKIAEQTSLHAIWLAANRLVKLIEERDLAIDDIGNPDE